MSLRLLMVVLSCVCCSLSDAAIAKAPNSAICESYGGQLDTCEIRTRNGIALKKRMSKNRCIEGETFGIYRRDQMWVDGGCRGEFVARRFGDEIFTRPGAHTSRGAQNPARPWVNPDTRQATGSWRNPDTSHRKSPQEWAYLAGRLYAKNRSRGYTDPRNAHHVKNALRKQGVDPSAIEKGGFLRGDFLRGLRSWR